MFIALWIYGLAHVGVLTGPPAVFNTVAISSVVIEFQHTSRECEGGSMSYQVIKEDFEEYEIEAKTEESALDKAHAQAWQEFPHASDIHVHIEEELD